MVFPLSSIANEIIFYERLVGPEVGNCGQIRILLSDFHSIILCNSFLCFSILFYDHLICFNEVGAGVYEVKFYHPL